MFTDAQFNVFVDKYTSPIVIKSALYDDVMCWTPCLANDVMFYTGSTCKHIICT